MCCCSLLYWNPSIPVSSCSSYLCLCSVNANMYHVLWLVISPILVFRCQFASHFLICILMACLCRVFLCSLDILLFAVCVWSLSCSFAVCRSLISFMSCMCTFCQCQSVPHAPVLWLCISGPDYPIGTKGTLIGATKTKGLIRPSDFCSCCPY